MKLVKQEPLLPPVICNPPLVVCLSSDTDNEDPPIDSIDSPEILPPVKEEVVESEGRTTPVPDASSEGAFDYFASSATS